MFIALATPSLFLRCPRHYWSRHCHSSSSSSDPPSTTPHTTLTAARREPGVILTKSFHMGQIYICANLLSNAKLLTIPRHIKQHGAASRWDRRVGCCSNITSSGDSVILSTLSARRSRAYWPADGGTADRPTTPADRGPQRPHHQPTATHKGHYKSHQHATISYLNLFTWGKYIYTQTFYLMIKLLTIPRYITSKKLHCLFSDVDNLWHLWRHDSQRRQQLYWLLALTAAVTVAATPGVMSGPWWFSTLLIFL